MSFLGAARRAAISRPLFHWFQRVLPAVSDTEREAIEAGTTWWDAELFSGRPDWTKLLATPEARLTAEEQAFLDGPVEELCRLLDDWQINFRHRDLPPEIWTFIKSHGFFGMVIPKEYGGLGFSAYAHSSVVMKLATRSITAAVTVMVPNSLGPGELLHMYGTKAQKDYYLPRLARGEEIPCFALTGPWNGSDAAAMPDKGIVCYGEIDGRRTLGMRVSWSKRYITLGPVATLLGLAFRLFDPDHLMGDAEEIGITLALVPTDTPGVEIGRRHFPAYQAFQNGPNSGKDVFIPMDWIIGGRERAGQGWRMLMSALAAGRAVSLPSLSTGGTKVAARTTGAYARVRRQFGIPIARFEGIEEPLARLAGNAYVLEAARRVTCAAIDRGEKPAVLSAIMKYHATERMRESVNDAMDVHGGKAVCEGPRNYLSNAYHALPVSITVEGANILTRSLIIFGQGSIRCHPYILKEMTAAQDPDPERGLAEFDRLLWRHVAFDAANVGRAFFHALTGGSFARAPRAGVATRYYRQASRWSAVLAVLSEAAMAVLGGGLKRREKLSARLGDVLSELYLMSCALKRFEDDGRPEEDSAVLRWCCENSLYRIQQRCDELLANFPVRVVAWILRVIIFPWGRRVRPPSDRLGHRVAQLLLEPSAARERLTGGIFIGSEGDSLAQLDTALKAVITAEEAERKLRNSRTETVEAARAAGVLSETEAELLERARRLAFEIITVDDFAPEEIGAGMRGHNRRGLDAASSRGETPSSTIVPAARSTS